MRNKIINLDDLQLFFFFFFVVIIQQKARKNNKIIKIHAILITK